MGRRFASAVRRNRAKRVIREAFRITAKSMDIEKKGFDLVFIPKRVILKAKTEDLIPEMRILLKKALA